MRLGKIETDPGQVERRAHPRSPVDGHPALRLQRSAGNRAVTSLITAAAPVQRMKGGEKESTELKIRLRDYMNVSEKELFKAVCGHHSLPEDTVPTSEQVWQYACKVYTAHRLKGAELWAELTKALAGRSDKTASEAEKRKSDDYDKRFANEYKYAGHASSPESFVGAKDQDASKPWPYHNRVSEEDHWITALHNDRKHDLNQSRMPNSEILWQQYKGVVHDPSSLDGITRSSIVNVATLVTIYMAYPNNEVPRDDLREWEPGTEEFFAVLGTENARSAAHLLIDHAHVLGKTISVIQTSRDSIQLPFAPSP